MPLMERYILKRVAIVFAMTLCALVGVLWMTQILRELDVVTAKGQTIWVFFVLTIMAMPTIIQVIAPIAFLIATIFTLNALNADSELPVMSAAGASRVVVGRPVIVLAIIVFVATAFLHHVITPASRGALRDLISRVRADIIATVVKDGGFRRVEKGLTIHIREKAPDGSFRGIFVSDERNKAESLQYLAEFGLLVDRGSSAFLIMQKGELIRETIPSGGTNIVRFETYAFDLSQFTAGDIKTKYKPRDRSTAYLLNPDTDDPVYQQSPEQFAAELHDRITAPLYVLAFALIILAFASRPRTNRQDRGFALVMIGATCVILRGAGFGILASAGANSVALPFLYLVPLAGIAFGIAAFVGNARLGIPNFVERILDRFVTALERMLARLGIALRNSAREV
jgi:lipopolysaccharide export system permease protein